MTRYDAIKRTAELNKAEAHYRKVNGLNPAFPWSSWGDRPRSCATWSSSEIQAITMSVDTFAAVLSTKQKLGVSHLCALAWNHGRSANGVREKLVQLLGFRKYYSTFEI